MASKTDRKRREPTIENRRARRDYFIDETLECGIRLAGTEVKSVREGRVSLGEGYVRAADSPIALTLHGVHIAEYPPAGEHRQHDPGRVRQLLAHRREIRKLAARTRSKGVTLVPLKMYFVRGRVKILIGLARGKRHRDKRDELARKQAQRDIDRAMTRARKS
jgi:SsrA-binding protein